MKITNRNQKSRLSDIVQFYIPIAVLLVCFLCANNSVLAQQKQKPDAAKLQKMIEEMKKKARAGAKIDTSELKGLAAQLGVDRTDKNGQTKARPADEFPRLYIGDIPRGPLTGKRLNDYIANLQNKAISRMSAADLSAVDSAVSVAADSLSKMAELSIYAFYNGGTASGLLLAMKVALKDIRHDLNLNNLSAMLITAGAPAQAIPILRGLVLKNPENAMILNNMGQSFAGVGLKDSAMFYFSKCLKQSPRHANANSTAARIAKSNGNIAKALEFAKSSVQGELTTGAMDLIDELDKSGDAYDFLAKAKDIPDYFNLYQFKKPAHQTSVKEAEQVKVQQLEFLGRIDRMISELGVLANNASRLGNLALQKTVRDAQAHTLATGQAPRPLMSPIVIKAARIFPNRYIQRELLLKMQKAEQQYHTTIAQEKKMLDQDLQAIQQRYIQMKSGYECNEGKGAGCVMIEKLNEQSCREKDGRIEVYLESCALAAQGFDKVQLQAARERFHFNSKWQFLIGVNEHLSDFQYYSAAIQYLKEIRKVVGYPVIGPACGVLDRQSARESELAKFEYSCPVNLNMELGIASLKANCKELSWTLKAPELVKFNFKKNFETGESTLSLIAFLEAGVGVGDVKGSQIGIRAGIKAEVYEAFFISFDKNNSFADAGIRNGANVVISVASGVKGEGAATTIEKGFESSFGINSGFSGGPKGMDGIGNSLAGKGDAAIGSWFR
jgi:hypothetical protein